jgi:hypothetical protein
MRSIILLLLFYSFVCTGQKYSIILGRPTDKSITASVLLDQNSDYYLEYGTATGIYGTKTVLYSGVATVPDEIEIPNLSANTRYYYRLGYKLKSANSYTNSPEYSFITQRSPGSSFTFTVEADEHLYDKKGVDNLYKICLANQLADKPDFMLSLGDTFGDDHYPTTITSTELKNLHAYYRPFLGEIAHSVPFYFCLGNHEGENNFYLPQNPPNNLTAWATVWRKYYYPNPSPNTFYSGNTQVEPNGLGLPENYYAWTWGDALFVVLDAYRYQSASGTSEKPKGWDWTLGKAQYDWLKTTLEGSKAKYKFVFAHHIRGQDRGALTNAKLYEWGGYEGDGKTYTFTTNRPGWAKPIHTLFKDTGVSIFFQGHDHLFAKETLDGITYQEVPMPSDSTYQIGMLANADAYTENQRDGAGHIRVNVTPTGLKVDYVKAYLPADTKVGGTQNREIGFSYSIGSPAVITPLVLETEPVADTFKIMPNPANTLFKIEGPPLETLFKLVNPAGQTIIETKSREIDVTKIPSGLYFLQAEGSPNALKIQIAH